MSDYWVKIIEKEEEDIIRHHYLVSASSAKEAKKAALEFIKHFMDEDSEPEKIPDGYAFCNRAIFVQIGDIKETTKEDFKDFLLKMHTINPA